MRRWLVTKWFTTTFCIVGLHRWCDGTTMALAENCYCDCHYRL